MEITKADFIAVPSTDWERSRAFYVNTPYREQNSLPIYDTSATDFNFATIYSENAFTGNDRISDSNVLTLGVDTRFLQPDTGALQFGTATVSSGQSWHLDGITFSID